MNGTYVNGSRIPAQSYLALNHLDSLRFGLDRTLFRVQRADLLISPVLWSGDAKQSTGLAWSLGNGEVGAAAPHSAHQSTQTSPVTAVRTEPTAVEPVSCNGHRTAKLKDSDVKSRRADGHLSFQISSPVIPNVAASQCVCATVQSSARGYSSPSKSGHQEPICRQHSDVPACQPSPLNSRKPLPNPCVQLLHPSPVIHQSSSHQLCGCTKMENGFCCQHVYPNPPPHVVNPSAIDVSIISHSAAPYSPKCSSPQYSPRPSPYHHAYTEQPVAHFVPVVNQSSVPSFGGSCRGCAHSYYPFSTPTSTHQPSPTHHPNCIPVDCGCGSLSLRNGAGIPPDIAVSQTPESTAMMRINVPNENNHRGVGQQHILPGHVATNSTQSYNSGDSLDNLMTRSYNGGSAARETMGNRNNGVQPIKTQAERPYETSVEKPLIQKHSEQNRSKPSSPTERNSSCTSAQAVIASQDSGSPERVVNESHVDDNSAVSKTQPPISLEDTDHNDNSQTNMSPTKGRPQSAYPACTAFTIDFGNDPKPAVAAKRKKEITEKLNRFTGRSDDSPVVTRRKQPSTKDDGMLFHIRPRASLRPDPSPSRRAGYLSEGHFSSDQDDDHSYKSEMPNKLASGSRLSSLNTFVPSFEPGLCATDRNKSGSQNSLTSNMTYTVDPNFDEKIPSSAFQPFGFNKKSPTANAFVNPASKKTKDCEEQHIELKISSDDDDDDQPASGAVSPGKNANCDNTSETGTYTIEKDNLDPEEVQARRDIDKVFGISGDYHGNNGKEDPQLNDNNKQTGQKNDWIHQWAEMAAEQTKDETKPPANSNVSNGDIPRQRRKLPTPPSEQAPFLLAAGKTSSRRLPDIAIHGVSASPRNSQQRSGSRTSPENEGTKSDSSVDTEKLLRDTENVVTAMEARMDLSRKQLLKQSASQLPAETLIAACNHQRSKDTEGSTSSPEEFRDSGGESDIDTSVNDDQGIIVPYLLKGKRNYSPQSGTSSGAAGGGTPSESHSAKPAGMSKRLSAQLKAKLRILDEVVREIHHRRGTPDSSSATAKDAGSQSTSQQSSRHSPMHSPSSISSSPRSRAEVSSHTNSNCADTNRCQLHVPSPSSPPHHLLPHQLHMKTSPKNPAIAHTSKKPAAGYSVMKSASTSCVKGRLGVGYNMSKSVSGDEPGYLSAGVHSEGETASIMSDVSSSSDISACSPRVLRRSMRGLAGDAGVGHSSAPPMRCNRAFSLRRARLGCDPELPADNASHTKQASRISSSGTSSRHGRHGSVSNRSDSGASADSTPTSSSMTTVAAPTANFARSDGGRYSLRLPRGAGPPMKSGSTHQPASKVADKNARTIPKDRTGSTPAKGKRTSLVTPNNTPRSNSNMSAKDEEMKNWKRRKEYDPMKAAAEGRKRDAAKKAGNSRLSCVAVGSESDSNVGSPFQRSASFHGPVGMARLRRNTFTTSSDRGSGEDDLGDSGNRDDEQEANSGDGEAYAPGFGSGSGANSFRCRSGRRSSEDEWTSEAMRAYSHTDLVTADENRQKGSPPNSLSIRHKNKIEALDSLVISTIHQLSQKLKCKSEGVLRRLKSVHASETNEVSGFDDLLSRLTEVESPTSPHGRSVSRDLTGILKNLKKFDETLQVVEDTLTNVGSKKWNGVAGHHSSIRGKLHSNLK